MSVESEDYLDRFETSGTDEFTITFPVQYDAGGNAKDIKVYYRNSSGLEYDITADCTIAGLVVTTPSAYAATTPASIITLLRYPDLKQLSVYTSGSKFPASQFQTDIDRLTFIAQRLDSEISRGLRTPVTDDDVNLTLPNKDERASTVLGFDADGAPMASAGIPSVPATAYMATLLDDEDVDEALATLDFIYYSKLYRHEIGEYFYMQSRKATTAWSSATPTTFFPAVEVTGAAQVFDVANYPDYVPYLRAIGIEVGGVSTFAGTAAASVITLADTSGTTGANEALLAALAEDTLFHGGYTDWRTVTWDGTDYPITNVNAVARTITVTGTPTAGAGDATLYSYRIAGSITTARLHKADGLVLATAGASGRVAGLRTRDAMQGHRQRIQADENGIVSTEYLCRFTTNTVGGASKGVSLYPPDPNQNLVTTDFITDGTNGTPRTGANTKDRSLAGYLYVHCGRYIGS